MLLLACGPLTRQGKGLDEDNGTTMSIMFTFSQAISGLESGLARGDFIALIKYAETMRKGAGKLSHMTAPLHSRSDQFANYAVEIKNRAVEIQSLAKKRHYDEVSQDIEHIRHTCISCHIRFRDAERNKYNLFPSHANIITGEVKIRHPTGSVRTDRSDVLVYLEVPPRGLYSSTFMPASGHNVFDERGHSILINTPYFAKTDHQGTFVISGVPDGNYMLKTWYESGQPVRHDIRVSDASLYRYDLLIEEKEPSLPSHPHPDLIEN